MNPTPAVEPVEVDCCIAGGGPAGMMLGYLLARAGVQVVVLEKHADFLRDFRGDTIHPSTLAVMDRLGLLDALLRIRHQEVTGFRAQWRDRLLAVADFSRLPTRCQFIAFMPQWDFLNLLAESAKRFPSFALRMQTEADALVGARDSAGRWTRIDGVRARGPQGPVEFRARLVVACDGRRSRMRDASGLVADVLGAPMDVLWFALERHETDGDPPLARFGEGSIFVLLNRGEQWQCGYVIAKGSIDAVRARGFDAFRKAVVDALPTGLTDAQGRVAKLSGWDDVSLLSVRVDRLREWAIDGLLCVGDAAHAMSPIGGVGINLAIQDAVATANLLTDFLRERHPTLDELGRVQRRRQWPTRATQAMQLALQKRVISRALEAKAEIAPPLLLRAASRSSWLRRQLGRVMGMGVRPELPRL